jgi:hypothetical protein
MANKIIITEDKVELIESLAGVEKKSDITIEDFYKNMSVHASFDTGILPVQGSGLLALRSALGYMQTAYIYEPGIWYINWGSRERSTDAKTYALAQPYRIVISDYFEGKVLGSRTLYSTIPIISGDEQLYHVNLPNLVCKGYGNGNCLGWLCLYHRPSDYKEKFPDKLKHMLDRSSGIETYNDGNMSGTDGPRFYKAMYTKSHPKNYNDYEYLWNPAVWEKKSKSEGFDWTIDDKLWIPIHCDSVDEQWCHIEGGLPLTFNRALYGHYSAYYQDKEENSAKAKSQNGQMFFLPKKKPFNIISRKGESLPKKSIFEALKKSIVTKTHYTLFGNFDSLEFKEVKGKQKDPFNSPIQKEYKCSSCEKEYPKFDFVKLNKKLIKDSDHDEICVNCYADVVGKCKKCNNETLKTSLTNTSLYGDVCLECIKTLGTCGTCNTMKEMDLLHSAFGSLQCYDCQPVFSCPNCATLYKSLDEIISGEFCSNCGTPGTCISCNLVHNLYDLNIFVKNTHYSFAPFGGDEVAMCDECMSHYTICNCKNLTLQHNTTYHEDTMTTTCTKCEANNSQEINFDDLINQG